MTNETRCRACGARISFIKTKNGKSVPVDVTPVSFVPDVNGNSLYVVPNGEDGCMIVHGCATSEGDKDVHVGYISHFATCPKADYFRKPRKKDRKAGEK